MFSLNSSSAQSSFGLNGLWGVSKQSFYSLNSYEYNPSNYSVIKDWALSFSYGSEFSNSARNNFYQFSAGKSFNDHFISLRYSPGYQKEFVFRSEVVTSNNSESSALESGYHYKELMGFGYSYRIDTHLSFGLNLRFFEQDFTQETVTAIFTDTVYFTRQTEEDKTNFWKADLGFVWQPADVFSVNIASLNLLTMNNEPGNPENAQFKMRTDRAVLLGAGYSPAENLNLNFMYETSSSFQAGISKLLNIGEDKIGIGITTFHDKEQNPFLAGIVPTAVFVSDFFDISLTWVKYFSDRKSAGNLNDFISKGITNVINNRFSNDKLLFTANFKLNTRFEPRVKFLDVEIKDNIYPSLAERYVDFPFATARVENLTNERIEIKPAVLVNRINNENIYSPVVTIFPRDTVEINFFTVIPDDYNSLNPEISFANFYLQTTGDEYDDKYQKAILINGKNAWDGNVHNLKYFIWKNRDFIISYAKEILSRHKSDLDTLANAVTYFYKSKIIFNELIKNMLYVSDPRATADYVQFPKETIELKGGDCDDLSVCFSALLESVGIETALVDYKTSGNTRHVNIMFNTKLSPHQALLITENDTKYFIRKDENGIDELWIPVETTALTGFDDAWSAAVEKFKNEALSELGLLKGEVEIIDVY